MTNSTDNLKGRVATEITNMDEKIFDPQVQDKISEENKVQKFMYQLISKKDGSRSEPFLANWGQLRQAMLDGLEQEPDLASDYILLVAIINGEDTVIPSTPLINVETFLNLEIK